MAGFKIIEVTKSEGGGGDPKVRKVEEASEFKVGAFEARTLDKRRHVSYPETKKKYGPLAATDPEFAKKKKEDRRFELSPLLRDLLNINIEEKRVIEERVKNHVAEISERVKKAAEHAGFNEGLKRGQAQALAEFRESGEKKLTSFEAAVKSNDAAKGEIFSENEKFVVDLSFRVAKLLFLKELGADRGYVTRLLKEIIEKIGVKENIKVRLNAKDMESADAIRDGLTQGLGSLKNLTFEASSDVALGGAIVETDWNSVDARVETQLKNIHDSLAGTEPGAAAAAKAGGGAEGA